MHLPLILILILIAAGVSSVSAGVVSVPFSRRHIPDDDDGGPPPRPLLRHRSLSLEALNNVTGGGYYAEFGVGTPPQRLSFQLDTGSSDTWVNSVDADLCTSRVVQLQTGFCQKQFSPNESSSFKLVARNAFDISYLDGRTIQGHYFKDTLSIDDGGGAPLPAQQLGLALSSVRPTGIMGLGFSTNVASRDAYPAVVDSMAARGLIAAPAFSMYLDDLAASSGVVLFGGVDTGKFDGRLATLALQPLALAEDAEDVSTYTVRLKGFGVSGVEKTGSVGDVGAVLDSGSTITLLPDALARPVWEHFGAESVSGLPAPFVDCALANSSDLDSSPGSDSVTFDFKFDGGKTIKVPLREMVVDSFPSAAAQDQLLGSSAPLRSLSRGWSRVCVFGVGSTAGHGVSGSSFAVLGDTFLRSAYVVYDMANKQVGVAQARHNSSSSSIVEFRAGSKTIPGSDKESTGVNFTPPPRMVVAGTLIVTVAAVMSAL